ncbi:autotransporter outer membrane beta-barrel domain-containing protein [Citrobacter tructae]|uniref:autotransporter outer membrane beta-barrel domain-containing protein n=1 Tax=Citrobacter tructae TaxID=2562449 RepID=UPI003F5774AB
MNASFKPTKIALVISALISSSAFAATPSSIIVDSSTAAAERTVTLPTGSNVSSVNVSVEDAMVKMGDNTTITSAGAYPDDTLYYNPGYFVKATAGTVDLGKNFTLNYMYDYLANGNYRGEALSIWGTGVLKAENLTINEEQTKVGNAEMVTAISLLGTARADLKGTTTISIGNIETNQDSVINAENVNISYIDTDPLSKRGHHASLDLSGKESNFTGNVNIKAVNASNGRLEGIDITGNKATFSGKTTLDMDNALGSISAIELIDTTYTVTGRDEEDRITNYLTNDVKFNELNIKAITHADAADRQSAMGFTSYSQKGTTDISINKLAVETSSNDRAYGVILSDSDAEGSAKYRIKDASIKISGGEKAILTGYSSSSSDGATTSTVIGNINIQSQGGKKVTLMSQNGGDDVFTGNVTLGSQASYESVSDILYSIYGYAGNSDGSTNIVNNNKLVAWGRMHADKGHTINIISGDNSYIHGDTVIVDNGAINMMLKGGKSRWDMTGDSTVNHLMLENSTLNFMPPEAQPRNLTRAASTFKTLTVNDDYVGNNGNIVMNSQLGDDASPTDRLIVAGNTSGTTNVKVLNAGGAGGLTTDGIELITVAGTSDGEFKQNGRIVAGAYDYTLARGEGTNDKNWYLSSALSPEDPVDPVYPVDPAKPADPTDPIKPVKPQAPRESAIRPEAGLYGMNLQAANTLFNTRLQDRLGETHYVDALTGEKAVTSLWLRNVGGHTRQKDSSGQLEMQANRYVMQLGGDIAQWSSDNADRFHLGLMAGYANQKARAENQRNGKRASSDISGYSVGLYGTWLQDNETHEGAYVDTWAQYSWFNNSVNGRGVDEATKEYDAKGFTASVESGYTWKLADISERNALYIQPKAQVTWMGVKADEHKEANGTRVEGKGNGNIQTRLGVRLYGQGHNQLDDGKDRTFQPFVEANWIHNTKDFGVALNGENVDLTGTRNIGELKAGVEGQLTKNVALWGNVAQQIGDKGYSDTSAMLGVKVAF